MADEENKVADETAQASQEAQKPDTSPESKDGSTERFYSQAEVNEMIRNRLARERRDAGETPKAKAPAKKASKSEESSELLQRIERVERDKAFSDAILDAGIPLTKGQRNILRRALDAEAPEDIGTWLEQAVADLGVKREEEKKMPDAPKSPATPATTPVAKVEDLERGMVHPNKLTREQVERMGPAKTWEYVQKYIGRSV